MEKKPLRKRINETIFYIARYAEIFISLVIMVVIGLLVVDLIYDITNIPFFETKSGYFTQFLSDALTLVVGVEFVKMLCKHTPETLIEVLMFATARQMVVEHLATWETLVGVVAIASLFAIRKFLFLTASDSEKITDKF